jgi:hypothetical protein
MDHHLVAVRRLMLSRMHYEARRPLSTSRWSAHLDPTGQDAALHPEYSRHPIIFFGERLPLITRSAFRRMKRLYGKRRHSDC